MSASVSPLGLSPISAALACVGLAGALALLPAVANAQPSSRDLATARELFRSA